MSRWRYLDGQALDADPERNATLAAIDAWWAEFIAKAGDIEARQLGRMSWDIAAWIRPHLDAIDPRLLWEFGPGVNRPLRLVITPQIAMKLRPMVEVLLSRAPNLPAFDFYSYQIPHSFEAAIGFVRGRTKISLDDYSVRVAADKDQRINLFFQSPQCTQSDQNDLREAVFHFSERILGEAVLDQWMNRLHVEPPSAESVFAKTLKEPLPDPVPIERMNGEFERKRKDLLDASPATPYVSIPFPKRTGKGKQPIGLLFDFKPLERPSYGPRQDLIAYSVATPRLPIFYATLGRRFFSSSHSRCGETFCYLMLDGRGPREDKFADRAEIQNAIAEALLPEGLGCDICGGTGLWYSYIDLALTDVERAMDRIRTVLRASNMSPNSWLLFHDTALRNEWLGVWPHTPPPPPLAQ